MTISMKRPASSLAASNSAERPVSNSRKLSTSTSGGASGSAAQPAFPGSSGQLAQHAQLPVDPQATGGSAARPASHVGAAQPTPDSQLPSDSARQPAHNPQDAEIDSIAGIAAWLGTLPEGTVGGSAPMKRLAEAVSTLQTLPSRDRRCQLQKLFRSWDVEQFAQSSGKRKLHDVEQSFEAKVIQEAKRLKVLQRSSATSSSSFSAIRLQLQR